MPRRVSGKRIRLMPLTRRSSVVVMKFSEPSNWPTQKMRDRSRPENYAHALAGAGNRAHRAQRRILRPSAQSGPVANEERRDQNHEGHKCDPERHHVEAGEGHVLGADLNRQKEIAESREGRGGQHKEDHDGAVHGHQLQVDTPASSRRRGRRSWRADAGREWRDSSSPGGCASARKGPSPRAPPPRPGRSTACRSLCGRG